MLATEQKLPMTYTHRAGCPKPTAVGLLDLVPKHLRKAQAHGCLPLTPTGHAAAATLLGGLSCERLSAFFADLGMLGSHRTVLSSGATGLGLFAQSRGPFLLAGRAS